MINGAATAEKGRFKASGSMSGTSMDGIDVAVLERDGYLRLPRYSGSSIDSRTQRRTFHPTTPNFFDTDCCRMAIGDPCQERNSEGLSLNRHTGFAMKKIQRSILGLTGALALAGTTYAQVPTSNDTSDTNGNTGMGASSLGGPAASNGGGGNTASGYATLGSNTTGYRNTASGSEALSSNTTGSYNTASGADALFRNTTGAYNTASGYEALNSNTTGGFNTASGYGALYSNNGVSNTASGYEALYSDTAGSENTASGYKALFSNTTSTGNTASGYEGLYSNTTGSYNTASGWSALNSNTTGSYNTASGADALLDNSTGNNNTASGYSALVINSTGSNDTASGFQALMFNTSGSDNTATGVNALYSNTTADYNTASGYEALYRNTGDSNTATGYEALYDNTSGTQNTATGLHALAANTTGSNNIAEGYHGGYNLTTGSNNIDIGSPGVKAESGVIRIGTISTEGVSTQSAAYIAGIYGVKTATAGTAVFIDSSGQLGTVSSSIRYKEDIQPIASASERLLNLRPVKFRYKNADASGEKPIQYGLIAEEVAEVYPELVVRDATTGRIDGVRYDELAPMLLNVVQQQQKKIAVQADVNAAQATELAAQSAEIRDLRKRQLRTQQQMAVMSAALHKLQPKDAVIAQH
jgi:hypothetical protein